MKRALQIMAVLLAVALTAQPVLAGVDCLTGAGMQAEACPMGMSAMNADCPMATGMSAFICDQQCCRLHAPQTIAVRGDAVRLKSTEAFSTVSEWIAIPLVPVFNTESQSASNATDSPPIYLLNRVFRI